MPLEKQSLNNFLPDGFETLNQEGYKTNFSEDKIKTGYEKDIKDRVSGPNLNNLIDVVGKNTNTLNNYVEYLNGMPINNVPTTDENGQLNYINLDDKLTKKQITNCILEIPQRIKYTLENGTLTIKAGSVVIVPYGTKDLTSQYSVGATFIHDNFKVVDTQFEEGKFFVWAELQNDIINSGTTTTNGAIINAINLTNNVVYRYINGESGTSTTTATKNYTIYYNTNNNLIRYCTSTTTFEDLDEVVSLPILISQADGVKYNSSIKQVFNGMGYIGSTIWVDKGVKGLMPNGRNEDGTLKNIEYTTEKVTFLNRGQNVAAHIHFWYTRIGKMHDATYYKVVNNINDTTDKTTFYHVLEDNKVYYRSATDELSQSTGFYLGWANLEATGLNTNITSLSPQQPQKLLSYADKGIISGLGMPSNKSINLTFGASESTYTAPANGWVQAYKQSTGAGQYITLINTSVNMGVNGFSGANGNVPNVILPVKKGDTFLLRYTAGGATKFLQFNYAEGEI